MVLDSRRQIGIAACPISEMQIEAFARLSGVVITPLDFELICRVDDAVMGGATKPAANPDAVPVSDGAGAAALMRGMGAKKTRKKPNGPA